MRLIPNIPALVAFADRLDVKTDDLSMDLAGLIEFLNRLGVDAVASMDIIDEDEPLPFASEAYLTRFRQRLLDAGKFEPDEVTTIMKHARAYAGGTASGNARRQQATPPDALSANENFLQMPVLFDVASMRYAEGAASTDWMQITPRAGATFHHPKYGDVTFTRQFASNMVDNFKNNRYQEHIPIDAEHATKLSGALGYYRDLRVRSDGAVEARIELTERGKALREQGGFKYFSPEFFRSWTDPATGRTYSDMLVGGAFTSRPFFKDPYLAPLAASESGYNVITGGSQQMERFKKNEDGSLALDGEGNPQLTDEAKAADAKALDDLKAEALTAAEQTAVEKFRKDHNLDVDGKPIAASEQEQSFAEQFPEQARQMSELAAANKTLIDGARRQKFSDIVTGRGGAADGAKPFIGKIEDHVSHLMSLSETFGEDSAQVTFYVNNQREHADQMHKAGLFSETGSNQSGAGNGKDATTKIREGAEALMAKDSTLTMGEATDKFIAANPDIYAESLD